MCHYDQLTVSDTPAAVTVVIENPGTVVESVVCVTPPENKAVKYEGYLRITTPEPPFPPLATGAPPPPPPPVFAEPLVPAPLEPPAPPPPTPPVAADPE
jgi:hypothetical protein